MNQCAPPRWLEGILRWCLPSQDRETISGDLLEEYRRVQWPQLGSMRANLWYTRQVLSFLAERSFAGSPLRACLTWLSVLTMSAGVWLAFMEQVLRHPGYAARAAVAGAIVAQGLATVLFLMLQAGRAFRLIVLWAAAGAIVLGASAIARILNAVHFEGFVLLIGTALMLQGTVTMLVAGRWQARARR